MNYAADIHVINGHFQDEHVDRIRVKVNEGAYFHTGLDKQNV